MFMNNRFMKFSQLFSACKTLLKITGCAVILVTASACSIIEATSSTSGTVDSVTPDVTLRHFVDVRIATIKKEAAIGYGENLDALAEMLGKEDKVAFGAWMQLNYDVLFDGLEKSDDLIARIERTLPNTWSNPKIYFFNGSNRKFDVK